MGDEKVGPLKEANTNQSISYEEIRKFRLLWNINGLAKDKFRKNCRIKSYSPYIAAIIEPRSEFQIHDMVAIDFKSRIIAQNKLNCSIFIKNDINYVQFIKQVCAQIAEVLKKSSHCIFQLNLRPDSTNLLIKCLIF